MLTVREAIENTLDAIELLVRWAVTWTVALIILGTPLLVLGLNADARGNQQTSGFFLGLMITVYGLGALLALSDLALRARSKTSIFVVMRNAWRQAATSRVAVAVSPVVAAGHRIAVTVGKLIANLLSLGVWMLAGLILAVIVGIALYGFVGLLGTAPWWAIVIIVLLIFK